MINRVTEVMESTVNQLAEAVESMINQVTEAMESTVNQAEEAMESILNQLTEALKTVNPVKVVSGLSNPTIRFAKLQLTSFASSSLFFSKAPTMAPLGTSPPTEDGTFGVGVPIYSLVYKLTSSNEPTTEDLIALKEATGSYLGGYFTDEFDGDDFTIYSQFINDIDGFTENTDTQVVVSYDSIVRFGQLSLIKPMPVQLGSSIEEAFTGVHMIQYEDYLKETLPEDNIFVGAKVQYYHGDGVSDKPSLGWLIGASASMTVLLAGLVLYNSKKDDKVLRFCFAKQEETLKKACDILVTI